MVPDAYATFTVLVTDAGWRVRGLVARNGNAMANCDCQMGEVPKLQDLVAAAGRISGLAYRTPTLGCRTLDRLAGATLFFKCENLQRTGAFKIRGAGNLILGLTPSELRNGVATHSSGNHAAAVAFAAKRRGVPAYIVMPKDSPAPKVRAVQTYGGQIVWCEPGLAAREKAFAALLDETRATGVPPYDDPRIIAGQATAAMELLEEVPDLDLIIAPVGGGGLVSGTALTARYVDPQVKVIAAEPSGADDTYRSFREGKRVAMEAPKTIADGLRVSIGELPFSVIQRYVSDVVKVDDEASIRAMRLVLERMKLLIEPSAAVAVAALLEGALPSEGKRIGVILSGGNVDVDAPPWCTGQ